jgi:hypothetical protein
MDPLILLKFTERIEVPRKFAAIGYEKVSDNHSFSGDPYLTPLAGWETDASLDSCLSAH